MNDDLDGLSPLDFLGNILLSENEDENYFLKVKVAHACRYLFKTGQ